VQYDDVYSPHMQYGQYNIVTDKQTDTITRSQAVARIANRTAAQHLWGSRDVIGHVTIL